METIKNYLETMFMNLPNTPEVYRAKQELLQMMEDKYQELKDEGKTENEAIGIVISEFGNLDEIAKDLGIEKSVEKSVPEGKILSLDEAKAFISDKSHAARKIAVAVMLFIMAFVPTILLDGISQIGGNEDLLDAVGASLLFVLIAIGVGLTIHTNVRMSKWDKLEYERYVTEFSTTDYVQKQWDVYKPTFATAKTLGIIFCVISVVPSIIADALGNEFLEDVLGGAGLFIFVGIGVFLLVNANIRGNAYMQLLELNDPKTVGGKYTVDQKKHVENPVLEAILSVYWPTVTCIYLIVSFLTFEWGITWIIWVIAAVINMVLNNIEGE